MNTTTDTDTSDATAPPVKILFVDDEENILRSLKRLMAEEDYVVFTATSGEAGLELVRSNPDIALIVSDQRMPQLTGVEFLEKAAEIVPDSLRILLTGYADITAVINAINKGGAYRYITKPWGDVELLQSIKDAVQRFSLASENRRLTEIVKKQNEDLKQWNSQLEIKVQEQTVDIRNRNNELQALNGKLKNNFKKSIEAFSNLIEMRDKTVSNHSRNVAALAKQTAVAMSMSKEEAFNIVVAALLHDIGKIGMADVVLNKPFGELTDDERKEYRLHPVRGQVAVQSIEDFKEVGIFVRQHHERVDGTGYPDSIKGEDIMAGSKIISMADAIDRIANSGQPGKPDYVNALKTIASGVGTEFDSNVFAFMKPIIELKISSASKQSPHAEIELHPTRLVPGMILSQDVRSGTGVLLLAKGMVLNQTSISRLVHHNGIDPFGMGVFVLSK